MKTQQTDESIYEFINKSGDEGRIKDCLKLDELCMRITGQKGKMWGPSIVGYGTYSYTRSDNKSYEYLALGFSPRKGNLTIYNLPGYEVHPELMKKLGKYKNGKSCLYVNSLEDIDLSVLEAILSDGYKSIAGKHLDYKTGVWSD